MQSVTLQKYLGKLTGPILDVLRDAANIDWPLWTDLALFWAPVYLVLLAVAPVADANAHASLMITASAVGAALYHVEGPFRVASDFLKWIVEPLVFAHAVSGTYFPGVLAAFIGLRVARLIAIRIFKAEEPVEGGELRVLLIGDAFEPKTDGVATFTTKAVKILPTMGVRCHVLTSARSEPLHGTPVTRVLGVHPPNYPEHSVSLPNIWPMFSTLYRFRPHVVHLVDEGLLTAYSQLICWFTGTPTVWSHHTRIDLYNFIAPILWTLQLAYPVLHVLRRTFASLGQGHLVVCEALRLQLVEAQCANVAMWHSGCDVLRFHPRFRDARLTPDGLRYKLTGGKPELSIALYVGRVAPEKNLHVLPGMLDELNGPNNERLTTHLVIVGDGPYRPTIEAALKGKAVTFTGKLPQDENLATIYASADCFISASTSEAFALVFVEALASGIPAVGADAGGTKEAFAQGEEGFRFAPEDPIAAARAVAAACNLMKLPEGTSVATTAAAVAQCLSTQDSLALSRVYTDSLRGKARSEMHVREKARLRAEAMSWEETYRQAVTAYRAARKQ